jgi:hypothetical protein
VTSRGYHVRPCCEEVDFHDGIATAIAAPAPCELSKKHKPVKLDDCFDHSWQLTSKANFTEFRAKVNGGFPIQAAILSFSSTTLYAFFIKGKHFFACTVAAVSV